MRETPRPEQGLQLLGMSKPGGERGGRRNVGPVRMQCHGPGIWSRPSPLPASPPPAPAVPRGLRFPHPRLPVRTDALGALEMALRSGVLGRRLRSAPPSVYNVHRFKQQLQTRNKVSWNYPSFWGGSYFVSFSEIFLEDLCPSL